MKPRSVRDVVENGLCAGCGLCEFLGEGYGLRMVLSDRGYLRPAAEGPLPRSVEHDILAACPGAVVEHAERGRNDADAVWGPVLEMHRAHATDPSVRLEGSSGGVVSALGAHLLSSGKVDGVIHVGAAPDDPLESRVTISRTAEQVLSRAGSRYAPSAPLARLAEVLDREERFAFIGKPCDVAGLRQLARADPRVDRAIPWMISFFCAGVPSLKGTEELLSRLGIGRAEVAHLRYRGRGWPGRFHVATREGGCGSLSYAESWGDVLSRHLQFRCKICPDGTGEFADIAAADAWLTADGYPDFEERDGWSAVVVRTSRGARLLQDARETGALTLSPLSPDELAAMQPYQRDRKQAGLARLAAVALAGGKLPRFRRLGLVRAALRAPTKWPRNFAGTGWRMLRGVNRE